MNPSNSGSCAICAGRNPYSNTVCESCGARLPWVNANAQQRQNAHQSAAKGDTLSPWLQIASFLVPLLGLIFFFAYRNTRPARANSAIQAAAWGFALNLILMLARAA